ncbi:hypothetical protein GCK72_022456 [Caenorhabditis remanei]|uniref:Uncharacterized protein n=1 Tax=Caenorhabditis remanei TaxID=31234 RepID=A0A6A5FU28_CAERE|nr:hypothetical protein GCK72_022456 [Caenorhabditis remanei]KAF1746005.1 hypothetical protein GCK72_022456 [Caenorhabditis remanei]
MENVITTINFWTIDNVVQTVLANQERRESNEIEAVKELGERGSEPATPLQDGSGSAFKPVTTKRHVFKLEWKEPAADPPVKPVSGVSEEDIQNLVLAAQSLLAQVGLPVIPVVLKLVENQMEVVAGAAPTAEENAEKSTQTDNMEDAEIKRLKERGVGKASRGTK